MVREIVEDEIKKGIKPERIILGGFSMGGSLAMHTAFMFDK